MPEENSEIKTRLLDVKNAKEGKFRVVLLIDSEQYQLGEDQDTLHQAINLYALSDKRSTFQIYDDKGEPQFFMGIKGRIRTIS